ncbi:MAG: hypothetical protein JO187_10245 [Acidobacteria bacterium]|nr:hypothetical protein [Acidobacteriota bacterium]
MAFAQRGFGGGFRTGGFHGGFRGSPRRPGVSFRFGSHNHRYSDSGLYSYPFYGDAFDSDYVQSSPQVIVIREEAKTPATAPDPTPPAQPKMIEVPASASATAGVTSSSPVVIVLRDGQRRELTRYTMTGTYLYDSSKALQTSRIAIEDLDLEATVHANAERGVPFEIPTQRNEVVVRF